MKTENEIIAMSLVERQKLWVELKQVQTNDKDYAASKAIIEVIEATDDWDAPEKAPAIATANCLVDGKSVKKDEAIQVYEWQFNALRRFLANPDEVAEKKAKKEARTKPGAAAALIAFVVGLALLGQTASAQVQTYLVGTQGQYNVQTIAGLNGGTNNVVGTNAAFAAATFTTNTAVTPTILVSNGVTSFTFTTNITSIVTNVPGMVSVVNYDSYGLQLSYALEGAGTPTVYSSWDVSGDGVLWQTNAFQLNSVSSGANQVTVYTNLIQVQYGYIRLNTLWNTNVTGTADILTNLTVEIIKKSNRQGP